MRASIAQLLEELRQRSEAAVDRGYELKNAARRLLVAEQLLDNASRYGGPPAMQGALLRRAGQEGLFAHKCLQQALAERSDA